MNTLLPNKGYTNAIIKHCSFVMSASQGYWRKQIGNLNLKLMSSGLLSTNANNETSSNTNTDPVADNADDDGKKSPTKTKRLSNPILPVLTQEQILNYSKVVSVNITGNRFSWCLIQRGDSLVTQSLVLSTLQQKTFNMKSKMHVLKILNEVRPLVDEVPPCQLCIIEDYPNILRAQHNANINLEMVQARAMFLGCLSSIQSPPQIVSIKTMAIARLFSTFIGSEKVSGQHLVNDIMETDPNIKMSEYTRNSYLNSVSPTKEYLSNVFLLNLAYWTLTNQFNRRMDDG